MTKRLSLRADGCQDIVFFCKHTDIAKRAAHAFSNMPLVPYRRLIADAVGTSEHPCYGEIVHLLVSFMDENGHPLLRRRYGRIHLGMITLFPTSDERRELLRDVVLGGRIGVGDVRIATIRAAAEEAENRARRERAGGLQQRD